MINNIFRALDEYFRNVLQKGIDMSSVDARTIGIYKYLFYYIYILLIDCLIY
jgi:hypothetical protein